MCEYFAIKQQSVRMSDKKNIWKLILNLLYETQFRIEFVDPKNS